jgi:HK97 gp10 family phage protein
MAVHVKIDLEGALDELLRRAQPALEEAARRCQRRAQDYCPVDTGALRRSIRTTPLPRLNRIVVSAGDQAVHYAGAIEFGTRVRPGGQPFMRPALNETAAEFPLLVAEALRAGGAGGGHGGGDEGESP